MINIKEIEEQISVNTVLKRSAIEMLEALREGTDCFESFLNHITEDSAHGIFTLKEIETDEDEFHILEVKNSKARAERYLNYLRMHPDSILFWDRLELELKKKLFPLWEISSETELRILREKGASIRLFNSRKKMGILN